MNNKSIFFITCLLSCFSILTRAQDTLPAINIVVRTNVKKLSIEKLKNYKVYVPKSPTSKDNYTFDFYVFKGNKIKKWCNILLDQLNSNSLDSILQLRFDGRYFDYGAYNKKGIGLVSEEYHEGKRLHIIYHRKKNMVKKKDYIEIE